MKGKSSVFLISIRSLKVKLILIFLLLLTATLVFIRKFGNIDSTATSKICGKYSISAKDNNERINFLNQFDLKVSPEPIEETEINIPSQFNKVYEKYNAIQKGNGLDLEKYKGKTCTKYTYKILNYNGEKGEVRANLLILDGRVIGGDICSLDLDGFMHGFMKNDNGKTEEKSKNAYSEEKTSAVNTQPIKLKNLN